MESKLELCKRRYVQLLWIDMNGLESKKRVKFNDPDIVEKVVVHESGTGPYISACYVKRWYNLVPKLRFLTNEDHIVEEVSFEDYVRNHENRQKNS